MANTETTSTKVITGKVRFSFVNVFEPKAFAEGQDPKYSVMLLIPKSDVATINRIKKAIDAAAQKGLSTKFGGKLPPVLKTTLKDADKDTLEEALEYFHDSLYIFENMNLSEDAKRLTTSIAKTNHVLSYQ